MSENTGKRMNKDQRALMRLKLADLLATRRRGLSGTDIAKLIGANESWVRLQLEKLFGLGMIERPGRYKWIGKRTVSVHALRVALGVVVNDQEEQRVVTRTEPKVVLDELVNQTRKTAELIWESRRYKRLVKILGLDAVNKLCDSD